MCLSSAGESAVPEPVAPTGGDRTPLARLIHQLQGSVEPSIADAGIARFARESLDLLSGNAMSESDHCLERAELMLGLMEQSLENAQLPEPETLMRVAQQVNRLLRDHRRWRELADNASYYRDHPAVAQRIARLL